MIENTNVGLVLEGGGMRGIFTAGVLDKLLDEKIYANYIIGVSAGACQAFSYVSRQRGRNYRISDEFIHDKRYLSMRNLLTHGGIFGMDFMFDDIPNNLVPYDFKAFDESGQKFVIGITNCKTGKAEYFTQTDNHDMFQICRASSSLPLLATPVKIDGNIYFDGGIADPIPIRKSITDGNKKNIIVLTRNGNYRKTESKKSLWIMKKVYPNYEGLCEIYAKRHEVYNDTLAYIEQLEKNGEAFVIRPIKPVVVGRAEKDKKKLSDFYEEGIQEMNVKLESLVKWLHM